MEFKKSNILKLAAEEGWRRTYYKRQRELYGFTKDGCHLEVHARTMQVITVLKHPRQGVSILFRNNIGLIDLGKIFKDPRVHTSKGIHKYN